MDRLRRLALAVGLAGILAGCGRATEATPTTTVSNSASSTTEQSVAPPLVAPAGVTLGPDGLAIVTVGESQASVMTTVTKALGTPTATGGGGCLDRTEVHWGDLSLEFHSGTLDGYRYLNGSQPLMGLKAPVPTANTPLLRTEVGATWE